MQHKREVLCTLFSERLYGDKLYSSGNYIRARFAHRVKRMFELIDPRLIFCLITFAVDGIQLPRDRTPYPRGLEAVPAETRFAALIFLVWSSTEAENECVEIVCREGGHASRETEKNVLRWIQTIKTKVISY